MPGAAGELGILANHAPLISLLKPGETRITDEAGTVRRYATDDGYVQVRTNRAVVLVGEALTPSRSRRRRRRAGSRRRARRSSGPRAATATCTPPAGAAAFAEAVAKVARR